MRLALRMAGNRAHEALQEWHRAELQARSVEQQLHRAWKLFFLVGGAPPAGELQRKAALLRAAAHLKLRDARALA
jgi:hypothetical protein